MQPPSFIYIMMWGSFTQFIQHDYYRAHTTTPLTKHARPRKRSAKQSLTNYHTDSSHIITPYTGFTSHQRTQEALQDEAKEQIEMEGSKELRHYSQLRRAELLGFAMSPEDFQLPVVEVLASALLVGFFPRLTPPSMVPPCTRLSWAEASAWRGASAGCMKKLCMLVPVLGGLAP